ncbi:hypothetical protein LJY25_03345 [Hymenobacter sp. BT175]|uniref:glycoside hydrolase family 113 n=1 Tax=Hymenobacter translucens TaxID=2886507 RepID=UPI001D0E2569|nr:hypothetical protein [Hymenobacter translucens]MCC2545466.1 hypothetical protein [Hymenobacter translucens]
MLVLSSPRLYRWLLPMLPVALLAALWWWPRFPPPVLPSHSRAAPVGALRDDRRLRGVSWVGGDSVTEAELRPLLRSHVTWIAQMPFGWQRGASSPAISFRSGPVRRRRGLWGETDAGLRHTAALARRHGIRTMLKPHLWVSGDGRWPGDVQMKSAEDWKLWFASYSAFILNYARLAEASHMDAFCIGTELLHPATEHEAEWRELIRQVRLEYHGPLTYAANWSGEFEQVKFWDALDFIGVQAYFPLSKGPRPQTKELLASWQEPLRRIRAVQRRYGKPVIFTEAGYKTTPDAAIEPWLWPDRQAVFTETDEATQARCYEALFATFWPQKWFKGVFIWKWYPGLQPDGPARRHLDFTPQHKEAEQIMGRWYKR